MREVKFMDWKVFTSFSGKDQISGAVKIAAKNTKDSSKKMGDSIDEVGRKTENLRDKIASIAVGVGAGNLLSKGISSAAGVIKNTINSIPDFAKRADEVGKTAMKLGLATDALQKFRYAAALGNVETSTLDTAFVKLSRQLGDGSLPKSLQKIDAGLAAQVKTAKSADEAFKMIASATSKYGDTNKRTAVLVQSFGRAGNQLVPMLGDLAEQLSNAEKYGNIISPAAIENATRFNDALTRVQSMVQGFCDIVRGAVVQHMVPLIEKFQEWAAVNREMIATNINAFIAKTVSYAQQGWKILTNLYKLVTKFKPVAIGLVGAFIAFKTVVPIIFGVKAAMAAYTATTALATGTTAAAGVSAATATMSFKTLASAIMGSQLAMAGLVGLAVAGTVAVWSITKKWKEDKADKYGVSVEGLKQAEALADEDFDRSKRQDMLLGKHTTRYGVPTDDRARREQFLQNRIGEVQRREEAAKTFKESSAMAELMAESNRMQKEMLGLMEDEIEEIKGLGKASANSPARLRWGSMGLDFWETARLGI
jgi:hypothetical protein